MKKKVFIMFGLALVCLSLFVSCNFGDSKKEPTEIQKEVNIIEIQNNITETYKRISQGCVGIYASDSLGTSSGSGVVYKEDNGKYYVVTNCHVVEGKSTVRVYRGGSKYYRATVVGKDAKNDIAVLTFSLDLLGGDPVFVNDIFSYDEEIVSVGQTVLAIGCPLGLENFNTLTTGVVSRIEKKWVQTNAEINPGNSGGGLFNAAGRLIGINTQKETYTTTQDEDGTVINIPVEGLGYAISLDVVKKCILDIESKKGDIERPLLGIVVVAVNRYISNKETVGYIQYLPNTSDQGIVISKVEKGVAQDSGVLVNDVILSINNEPATNLSDLEYILHTSLAGETLEVTVYRPSTEKELTIKIVLK